MPDFRKESPMPKGIKCQIFSTTRLKESSPRDEWVALNADALVAYWEGQIDVARLCQMLKSLPAQQTMP